MRRRKYFSACKRAHRPPTADSACAAVRPQTHLSKKVILFDRLKTAKHDRASLFLFCVESLHFVLLLCALRAARLRRIQLPAQVARQHPAVKQGEHTRQKQQDEQNGRKRADGDRAADLLDGEVAEKAPVDRRDQHEDRAGGQHRVDAAAVGRDECIAHGHTRAHLPVIARIEDAVVDRRTHEDTFDDQQREVIDLQPLQVDDHDRDVHAALHQQHQQRRNDQRAEREHDDEEDRHRRQERDEQQLTVEAVFHLVAHGAVADEVIVPGRVGVKLAHEPGNERARLGRFDRQRRREHEPGVIAAAQLRDRIGEHRLRAGDLRAHIVGQEGGKARVGQELIMQVVKQLLHGHRPVGLAAVDARIVEEQQLHRAAVHLARDRRRGLPAPPPCTPGRRRRR